MKHFLRPSGSASAGLFALAGLGLALSTSPAQAHAQAQQLTPLFEDSNTQSANAAQGYLGVDIADVDAGKVQALKLKDTHGAVITLIDHDAPAGQIGLRINDVVLQLDGQNIETADQLRRMLKDLPPGRKVTLEISREGNLQAVTVVLVDRKAMEQSVWHKLGTSSGSVPEMGILSGDAMPSGFHLPSFGSTLKVGALVEPLTTQMAAYLGVESGLMVKQVARKSEAEKSGLRAFDVILKVGSDFIATSADWNRSLVANRGKPVQVTILRDKKQQTLTLQVDSKHQKGALEQENLLGPGDEEMMAELGTGLNAAIDQQLAGEISAQAAAAAQAARAQAEALRDEMARMRLGVSPEAAEQLRQQAEKLRESMKAFQADPQQMQEMQRQMEEFRQQMEEFRARIEGRFV
jgi:serine protease Do